MPPKEKENFKTFLAKILIFAPAEIMLYLTAPTFCFLPYEHTFITSIEYDAQEQ
jgi:hypothetical protein